jgi:ATP-dependent Clp protease protease subunit
MIGKTRLSLFAKALKMFEIEKNEDTIWFYDVVGADFLGGVSDGDFKKGLDSFKGGDITIRVNSPGGDVHTALSIFNQIKNYKGKVTVAVDALAASAASYFPMAADEVVMAENALMMIHAPLTIAYGNSTVMMETAELLDKHAESMSLAYESKTGKSSDEIKAIFDQEVWYTAAEAVENGFADRVESSEIDTDTQLNNSVFNFKHVPAALQSDVVPRFAASAKNRGKINAAKIKAKIATLKNNL